MKKSNLLDSACAGIMVLITTTTYAAVLPLEGRLPETPGGTDYQAYYDPNLDITWAANANINDTDIWDNQVAWAAGLTIGGVDGWRLPSADVNGDGTVIDCFGSGVIGCEDNEMGYLRWEEGITAVAPGPFANVQPTGYWSGTEETATKAWHFVMSNGIQGDVLKINTLSAWAVVSGDVGVGPAPPSDDILDYLPAIIAAAKSRNVEPPAPIPEGVIILDNHSHYVDTIDYLHITGEVFNNTSDIIRFVEIVVNVFNGEQFVDTDFTFTKLDNMQPGDKACFDLFMPAPSEWTSYEFEAALYRTDGEATPTLTAHNLSDTYISDFGWYEIIGLVTNESERYVEYVSPIATLYDVWGTVRGCDFTFVNSTHLDPGQTSSFELTASGRDYQDIASYGIQVDGR